ncbi:hypothetical protein, partial [Enterobacter mori]
GSSATKDVGTAAGNVQVVGGLGGPVDAYRFFLIEAALPSNTINLDDARNPGVFPNLINFTTAVKPSGCKRVRVHSELCPNCWQQWGINAVYAPLCHTK